MIKQFLYSLAVSALLVAGSPVPSQAQTKVKVAEVIRSQFYIPMYVALSKGFAKNEGLDVEITTANGGDRIGALMLSGQVDIGLAGPETPIYIYNSESPDKPKIFCALTGTDGFFLVSRGKIGAFDWSMLKGKKILGYRPGSTPELYLEYVMKQHGLDDATLKQITTNIAGPAREGAWVSGAGEFGIFTEPSLSKLEKSGQLHTVASIGKEVGRADYTAFFANTSWLKNHRDVAQKWTNAIAHAQVWMRTASTAEVADAIKSYFPGVSADENVAVVERFRNSGAPIWSDLPQVDPAGLAKIQEIMVSGGTLPADKVLPYDTIVDASFAKAVTASQ
jgi:NitT/TauT family transport system substrate-binding protein